ncbi:MAG: hypothetical protein ACRCYR_14480 [Phycicoccus sp.]
MPRRNRVDPWGDPNAVAARGLLTGNRGCLVDDAGRVVRHHASRAWISCRLEFRGWRHPLDAPRRWTPLFFLDDAVALAAGHRPCATCRREDYRAYRDAVGQALGVRRPMRAVDLDARLTAERMTGARPRRGRGLHRAGHRLLTEADWSSLPDGVVVVVGGRPAMVHGTEVSAFGFDGWGAPSTAGPHRGGEPSAVGLHRGGERSAVGLHRGGERSAVGLHVEWSGPFEDVMARPSSGGVAVLTPPTSVLALRHGFRPVLHASTAR